MFDKGILFIEGNGNFITNLSRKKEITKCKTLKCAIKKNYGTKIQTSMLKTYYEESSFVKSLSEIRNRHRLVF